MSRGVGEFEPLRELLPPAVVGVLALVTQLGDVWFLSLVVVIVYWTNAADADRVVGVVGVTLTGFAVINALKRAFALPRPPSPVVPAESVPGIFRVLYETAGTASGYGFPSGHAFMTTVVYLSLVAVVDVGTRRQRVAGAAALVGAVCLSRVALGVHYLVDVVVGVVLGLLVLGVARWLLARRDDDRGTTALGLAVVAGGADLAASGAELVASGPGVRPGADPHSVLLFGAALGAFGGWQLVLCGRLAAGATVPSDAGREFLARAALATAALAPLFGALDEVAVTSSIAGGAVLGILTAALVTAPVLRHSERARAAWPAVSFWGRQLPAAVRLAGSPGRWRRLLGSVGRGVRRAWNWLRSSRGRDR